METVTETNRQSSQVDRQVGRGETDRQSGRRTGGGRLTDSQVDRQVGEGRETWRLTERLADSQVDRQVGKVETHRQSGRQTGGEGRD